MSYQIVYRDGQETEPLDTIYYDYARACREMSDIAKEAFAENKDLEGVFTIKVLDLPTIGRGESWNG